MPYYHEPSAHIDQHIGSGKPEFKPIPNIEHSIWLQIDNNYVLTLHCSTDENLAAREWLRAILAASQKFWTDHAEALRAAGSPVQPPNMDQQPLTEPLYTKDTF